MYYGYYSATNGSGQNFLSEPQDNMEFPPQVMYNNTSFRYMRSYQVGTPHMVEAMMEWMKKMNATTGVEIPRKKK